jgi:hypothetical protein
MKKLAVFAFTISTFYSLAQTNEALQGAWGRTHLENQQTLVFANGYWSFTEFNIENKQFIGTMGGSYSLSAAQFNSVKEYDTFSKADNRNNPLAGNVKMEAGELHIGAEKWARIDDGSPGDLHGAWLITGRERNGQMSTITPGARKTMKILSGTRFQWIAYNSETMQFMGTGGGTYSAKDGQYVENIEFFSRDNSRVGASLSFDYQLKGEDWHHSGKSSKGQPIYEIWSLRE